MPSKLNSLDKDLLLWRVDRYNINVLCFYSKKKICAIYGKWTECLYTVDPAAFDLHKKADKKTAEEKKGSKQVRGFCKTLKWYYWLRNVTKMTKDVTLLYIIRIKLVIFLTTT